LTFRYQGQDKLTQPDSINRLETLKIYTGKIRSTFALHHDFAKLSSQDFGGEIFFISTKFSQIQYLRTDGCDCASIGRKILHSQLPDELTSLEEELGLFSYVSFYKKLIIILYSCSIESISLGALPRFISRSCYHREASDNKYQRPLQQVFDLQRHCIPSPP